MEGLEGLERKTREGRGEGEGKGKNGKKGKERKIR